MADALKAKYGVDATLIESKGGVFDVRVDDALVWSKHDVGRFPEHTEVFEKIDALGVA